MYAEFAFTNLFPRHIDLLVANEWFCNWCSFRQNVDVESAFAIRTKHMFCKIFLGAGLKLYKYESRVFNLSRILYFVV